MYGRYSRFSASQKPRQDEDKNWYKEWGQVSGRVEIGMMKIILIVAVAYFLTGAYYIMRELRQPYVDQPEYVRHPKYKGSSLIVLFGWLPITIMSALQNRLSAEGWSAWVCFAVLSVAGVMLL